MIESEKPEQAGYDCCNTETLCLHVGPQILITYQDSPDAPKNEEIREYPKAIVEGADKDIAVGNADLKGTNEHVYIVKDRPACYEIMF